MKRDALKEPDKFLVAFHLGGGTVTHVTKSYRNGDDFFTGGQVKSPVVRFSGYH